MRAVLVARAGEPAWDASRQERVFAQIRKKQADRARRSRAVSVALSSLVGVALIVLAARALGSSSAPTSAPHDDGGSIQNG